MKFAVTVVRRFEGRRISLVTDRDFDSVVGAIERTFQSVDLTAVYRAVSEGNAQALRTLFEEVVRPSGFCIFQSLDQGTAMALLGSPMKAKYYMIGNALIAKTLLELDSASVLCAPVRVAVSQARGGKTAIDYDEPSGLFSQFDRLANSPVPRMLDQKLEEALTNLAG